MSLSFIIIIIIIRWFTYMFVVLFQFVEKNL